MSHDTNTVLEENLTEQLEELFDNDKQFHMLVEEIATANLDSYDHDDVDSLEENAFEYLAQLQDDMLDGFDDVIPNSLDAVKEWAMGYLEEDRHEDGEVCSCPKCRAASDKMCKEMFAEFKRDEIYMTKNNAGETVDARKVRFYKDADGMTQDEEWFGNQCELADNARKAEREGE